MIPQQSSHSRWSYDTKPGNHSLCSKQYMYKHTSAINCLNIVDSMRKILLPCSLSMSMESDQSYSHARMVSKARPMLCTSRRFWVGVQNMTIPAVIHAPTLRLEVAVQIVPRACSIENLGIYSLIHRGKTYLFSFN